MRCHESWTIIWLLITEQCHSSRELDIRKAHSLSYYINRPSSLFIKSVVQPEIISKGMDNTSGGILGDHSTASEVTAASPKALGGNMSNKKQSEYEKVWEEEAESAKIEIAQYQQEKKRREHSKFVKQIIKLFKGEVI